MGWKDEQMTRQESKYYLELIMIYTSTSKK